MPLRLSLAGLMASVLLTLPFSGLSFAATYSATAPTIGTGSLSDPYQISTPDQLVWMDQHASGSSDAYELTANIDLTGYTGWVPITGFAGTFNGQGYTISNLTTNTPVNSSVTRVWELGVFGDLTSLGTVENVTFNQWTMNSTDSSVYTAGLVADNLGQVTHVTVTNATLSTLADNLGVLIGYNSTTDAITGNTVQTATITDDTAFNGLGGLVGTEGYVAAGPGNITDNTITGLTLSTSDPYANALGGIIGYSTTGVSGNQVSDSTLTQNTTSPYSGTSAGGIVGYFSPQASQSVTSNEIDHVTIVGSPNQGGIIGYSSGGSTNAVSENQVASSQLTTNNLSNLNDGMVIGYNNQSPVTSNVVAGTITFQSQSGEDINAGGLVGFDDGSSLRNFSDVAITFDGPATYDNIGGAIGYNQTPLSDTVSTGSITLLGPINGSSVGNLVGYNDGPITNAIVESQVQLPPATEIQQLTMGGVIGNQASNSSASLTHVLAITHDGLSTLSTTQTSDNSLGAIAGLLQTPLASNAQVYWDTSTEPGVSAVPIDQSSTGMTGLSTTALASGQAKLGSAWTSTTQAGIPEVALPMLSGFQTSDAIQLQETATTPFVANSTQTQLTASLLPSFTSEAPSANLPILFHQQTPTGTTDTLAWTQAGGTASTIAPSLSTLPSQVDEWASLFGTVAAGPVMTPKAMPTTLNLVTSPEQTAHTLQVTTTLHTATPLVGTPSGTFSATVDGHPVLPLPTWQIQTRTASTLIATTTIAVYGGPHMLAVTYTDPSGLTATATATLGISTAPSRLSGLSVTQVTATGASLQWPAIAGTTRYTVQVNQDPVLTVYQPDVTVALDPASQSTVTVQAVYGTTASMPLTTTITTPPPPVSTLAVTPGPAGSGTATDTWSAVYGANSYLIATGDGGWTGLTAGPVTWHHLPQNQSLITTIEAVYDNAVSTPASVSTFIPAPPVSPILPPAPSITAVTPSTATTDTSVTITGTAFGSSGTVTIQQGAVTTAVTPTLWSASQIVFVLPTNLVVGSARIQVTANNTHLAATAPLQIIATPVSTGPISTPTPPVTIPPTPPVTIPPTPPVTIPPTPPIHAPAPTLPPSTSTRLVLAPHHIGSLDVTLPNRSIITLSVIHPVESATSIQVRYLPGIPTTLPNVLAGYEVFQLSVTNPLNAAHRITWLPARDDFLIYWRTALPKGTTIQRWDVAQHRWVIMARARTATRVMKAPLPHMATMTYVLVPPTHPA